MSEVTSLQLQMISLFQRVWEHLFDQVAGSGGRIKQHYDLILLLKYYNKLHNNYISDHQSEKYLCIKIRKGVKLQVLYKLSSSMLYLINKF